MFKRVARAYSLIELMLGISISSILILGTLQTFLLMREVFNTQAAINALQENGRFATYFLTQRINAAGYKPCTTNNDPAIIGYTAATVPANYGINPVSGSDVIQLGRCEEVEQHTEYVQTLYFIGKTSYGKSALFVKRLGHLRQEIVPEVNNMNIEYGLRNNGNMLDYAPASAISNWQRVGAVSMKLELVADSNSLSKHWYLYAATRNP